MKKTVIGLGLAALGRPEYINLRQEVDTDKTTETYKKNAFNVLDFAYKQGIRHFDTAPSYGQGESFLKEWYLNHPDADVSFSTKWGYTYVANWEIGYPDAHEIKEHSLQKLLEQWKTSKGLLPALDIYQIHSATFDSGVLKNTEVLQELYNIKKSNGIKLGISTSGDNQSEVIQFAANVKIEDHFLFDSFQVSYNILEISTHKVLRNLIDRNKLIIVKEALANGRLLKNKNFAHYQDLYRLLDSLSRKYKVTVDAIALRFVIDYLEPHIVLSGASNTNQLFDNLGALRFELEENDIMALLKFSTDPSFYWNERKKLEWN